MRLAWIVLAACGASPPATKSDQPSPDPAPAPVDAAVATAPDAGVPEAVIGAPAWVFRYHTKDRSETWTLRHAGGNALLVVETANGTTRYTGSATEGPTLALAVATTTARLSLACKRDTLAVGATCNDVKAKPIEVLSCFHPDFKTPMPFGHAPGIEYIVDGACSGYRLLAP
jgi:hypothetical protein